MRKSVMIFILLLSSFLYGGAQELCSFAELRSKIDNGLNAVENNLYIEGYNIVMGGWGNIAQNTNRYHSKVNTSTNTHTIYIQDKNASFGFCIRTIHSATCRKLKMGDRITINLKGAKLSKTESGMYVIGNIDDENILRILSEGTGILPLKEKYISELCDSDLCTFVTLKDCEFVFKDGSYINIYETYGQNAGMNKIANPNESMDGWASLLCDSRGNLIYSVCNTGAAWRRSSGEYVPAGRGKVSGTILADSFPRYSAFPLGYQIRCMNQSSYQFTESSSFKSIAEWNWNDGKAEFNTASGARKNLGTASVKADIGEGLLGCTVDGNITRARDFNNPKVEKADGLTSRGARGVIDCGSLSISTPACNWWDWEKGEGKGIVVSFSSEGISGERMLFGFTFGGGNLNPETSVYFPAYWKVQYSFDAQSYKDADSNEISCRSIPWYWGRPIKGCDYSLSYECGLGLTDHLVTLPKECFGKKNVYVRVIPSRRNAATYSVTSSDKAAITKGFTKTTVVNFGSVIVRYQ